MGKIQPTVKVPTVKSGDLSSVSGSDIVEGGN